MEGTVPYVWLYDIMNCGDRLDLINPPVAKKTPVTAAKRPTEVKGHPNNSFTRKSLREQLDVMMIYIYIHEQI